MLDDDDDDDVDVTSLSAGLSACPSPYLSRKLVKIEDKYK
jgi:hypothetical protein